MTRQTIPDLLPGSVDLLIPRTLLTQSLHGWAIAERIQQTVSVPALRAARIDPIATLRKD